MTTFICIASGPSLTQADCELALRSGYPVIAVNSSWKLIPECQYLFAADCDWWDKYHGTLQTDAIFWTVSGRAQLRYGINLFQPPDCDTFNSGQRAIQLAAHLSAQRIILLGYDCSLENGTHWHGDHPAGLKNPDVNTTARWIEEFSRTAKSLSDLEIINCSRQTTLTCFPRLTIEAALNA